MVIHRDTHNRDIQRTKYARLTLRVIPVLRNVGIVEIDREHFKVAIGMNGAQLIFAFNSLRLFRSRKDAAD